MAITIAATMAITITIIIISARVLELRWFDHCSGVILLSPLAFPRVLFPLLPWPPVVINPGALGAGHGRAGFPGGNP
eukprot:487027-Lingulodinium_polyedra.AAC.1